MWKPTRSTCNPTTSPHPANPRKDKHNWEQVRKWWSNTNEEAALGLAALTMIWDQGKCRNQDCQCTTSRSSCATPHNKLRVFRQRSSQEGKAILSLCIFGKTDLLNFMWAPQTTVLYWGTRMATKTKELSEGIFEFITKPTTLTFPKIRNTFWWAKMHLKSCVLWGKEALGRCGKWSARRQAKSMQWKKCKKRKSSTKSR